MVYITKNKDNSNNTNAFLLACYGQEEWATIVGSSGPSKIDLIWNNLTLEYYYDYNYSGQANCQLNYKNSLYYYVCIN